MAMTALTELIALLESATEGSRELNARIIAYLIGGEAAVSPVNYEWCVYRGVDREGKPRLWHASGREEEKLPRYSGENGPTRSLDAALKLLPHGYAINNMMIWPGCPSTVTVVETREDHDGRFIHHGGDRFWQAGAATAPIAICIACLRAREPSDDPPVIAEWEGTMGEIVDKDNELSVFDNQGQDTQPSVVRWGKEHVQRIRAKAATADGLGPFWRGMMLAALDAIDAERAVSGKFGVALIMIREGAAEPHKFAARILTEAMPQTVLGIPSERPNTDKSKEDGDA